MDPSTVFWVSYLGFGAICTVLELIRPAHKVRYRKAIVADVIALLVVQYIVVQATLYAGEPLAAQIRTSPVLGGVWLPLRLVAYYLLADCGAYWVHRLMHTRHFWRVHRWHHSPTQLYWLAGVRTSLPQQLLVSVPFLVATPLIVGFPVWAILAVNAFEVGRNHWMHMNFTWRSNWLERVIVTPRYHHIHHSADAKLHDGNYGSLFSIWDRLFGTYIDPDLTAARSFGTGEKPRDPVLLMIGI